jgi:hypothetical protein
MAKGPTAKNIYRKDHPQSILVGINQGLQLIDDVDYVFMNDIESLCGLTSEDLRGVKTFVIPEYPHKKCRFDWSNDHVVFCDRLKELDYKGNVLLFNLHTSMLPRGDLINVSTNCTSTTHTAIYCLNKMFGYDDFETYGFLKKGKYGYLKEMENMADKNLKLIEEPWYLKSNNVSSANFLFYEKHLNEICKDCNIKVTRF